MNRLRVALVVVLALGTTTLARAGDDPGTPDPPRTELQVLTSFAGLQVVFNRDAGFVRMVALLSPSCGYCVKGYRYMRKILEEVPDERLRMYVVWEPMLSADTEALAGKMSRRAKDARMAYQAWDAARITGELWSAMMADEAEGWKAGGSPAWDVYFLYDAGVTWAGEAPTAPAYWQHQGAGPRDRVLNYKVLKARVEAALARLEETR